MWVRLHRQLANWNHQLRQVLLVRTLLVSILCLCWPTTWFTKVIHISPKHEATFKYSKSWIWKTLCISFCILVIPTSSSHWHMLFKPDILVVYLQSLDAVGTRFCCQMKKILSKGQVEERWRASPYPSKCFSLRNPTRENQTSLLGSFHKPLWESYSWRRWALISQPKKILVTLQWVCSMSIVEGGVTTDPILVKKKGNRTPELAILEYFLQSNPPYHDNWL